MEHEFLPKWIAWEITRRCNLSCVHCRSASFADADAGDISTDEGKRILKEIADYCKSVVVLSGGEPLLREDVFELAEYGTSLDLRMCLATNGMLVNDDICNKIHNSGIRICSLSLDGSTAQIHDNFRNQKGAFDGAINAAKLFKKHGIDFIINSSFTKRNEEEIPKIYKLAKEIGATAWYMFMVVPTGRGEEMLKELITNDNGDYDRILEWHYNIEQEEDELLMRPTCAPHYYRITMQKAKEEGKKYKRRNLKFSTGGAKGCIAGQVICMIDCFGNVQPCSYFHQSAGNLKKQSFKEIWEESELFQNLRSYDRYEGKCGACEYIKVCGGCRARAAAIHGNYMAEEPFCEYIPKKLRNKKQ